MYFDVLMIADPNAVDGIGRTSLHYAAFAGEIITSKNVHYSEESLKDHQAQSQPY